MARLIMRISAVLLLTTSFGFAQDADWKLLDIPAAWRKVPTGDLAPKDGYSWYRCLVKIPADWKGAEVSLHVEAIDDARASYVNGKKVGATGTFPPRFRSGLGENGRFKVDSAFLKAGEDNIVAIRVFQNDPRPNFSVAPPVLLNETSNHGIRLEGKWQYRPGDKESWSTATANDFGIAELSEAGELESRGAFITVDAVTDVERYVRRRSGDNDPLSPKDAEQSFEVPDDLQLQLVLSEPEVSQPLFMTWDARKRLWVMEYRQYPEVAGVKMISRDVYLRSVYDKVPEPPPHGVRGRDRISIHEDTDGDGVYDKHKVFVDGLNIATSMAIGRGGVFVANPPYLLFYPDKDGDDVPDGDPEVLLEGFGLEDSHSVINSIRFGPDGWLYGAQGSTVSAKVKRPGTNDKPIRTMGQQIWRYHPEQKRFEVFAEGGGNTFGVELDAIGQVYSGHNGGDTRGFHYVQGGYYRKGFTKHGPLSNPYAFGFFANMKHHSVPRFTHNFIIYEENVLPEAYRGRLFGVEPLQGQVVMSDFRPYQSSYETKDLSRVVKTKDQWCRPVDIKAGPDGAIYFADMYEQRIDHSSHYAGRIDRSSGRIYRLLGKGPSKGVAPASTAADISDLGNSELLKLLQSPRKWERQTALRVLGDRRDSDIAQQLLKQIPDLSGQSALESLWALNLSGGFNDDVARDLLQHEDQFVRAWTVRLLCDDHQVSPPVAGALVAMAADEPYLFVRKQLASSAKRLPADVALPIIHELLQYDEDSDDIHQPLLVWWALESKTPEKEMAELLTVVLPNEETWQRALVQNHIADRLMKRLALSGTREELLKAATLFEAAPDKPSVKKLLSGFEEAYKGRSLAGLPTELVDAIAATGGGSLALRLRQGDPAAIEEATSAIRNTKVKVADRRQYLEIFGQIGRPELIPELLRTLKEEKNPELFAAACTALQAFDDNRVGEAVVAVIPLLSDEPRAAALTLAASRSSWAGSLLAAVDTGRMNAAIVSETALRKMLLHNSDNIRGLVKKHWGSVAGANTQEMTAEIARVADVLSAGSGNPKKGKPLFLKNCGKCHLLFGEGGRIGPDLTSFKRDDEERILKNVINPGLEIREGFENYIVVTTDGRVMNGFLADQDSQVIVVRTADGQNIILQRDAIEEMSVSKVSVMPERTLVGLTDQQLRDLFAYLRASQPVNY